MNHTRNSSLIEYMQLELVVAIFIAFTLVTTDSYANCVNESLAHVSTACINKIAKTHIFR